MSDVPERYEVRVVRIRPAVEADGRLHIERTTRLLTLPVPSGKVREVLRALVELLGEDETGKPTP